jgi:hypothetical protein
MLRGIRRFAIIGAGVLAVGMATLPASAAGAAAGAVTGTVNLSPGFTTPPPAGLANQNFTFSSVVLTGAGASTQCAGVVSATATASGASIAETVAGGVGNLSINASGSCTIGSVSIGCAGGVYVRIGVLVAVVSPCTVAGQVAASAVVVPVSLFIGNQIPPATITSATFAGVWALVSA